MYLFFITDDIDIASYVYDNTPYESIDNIDEKIYSSEQAANILLKWFNLYKGNIDNCRLLGSSSNSISTKIRGFDVNNKL